MVAPGSGHEQPLVRCHYGSGIPGRGREDPLTCVEHNAFDLGPAPREDRHAGTLIEGDAALFAHVLVDVRPGLVDCGGLLLHLIYQVLELLSQRLRIADVQVA
jgi:hypothetical protein